MRGLNVAREIRRLAPDACIAFYTHGAPPDAMREPWLTFYAESTEDQARGTRPDDCQPVADAESWARCMTQFAPHAVVFDTMLPASEQLPARGTATAYIMRKCQDARQREILADPLLSRIDQLLVPHTPQEFGLPIPVPLAGKTAFVGPIVRLPEARIRQALRRKYELRADEPLLVSTTGGGGFADDAQRFIQIVCRTHELLLSRRKPFQHLVILGPKFSGLVEAPAGMRVITCEPELASLLAEATLVVAAGGYNTVHEVRAAQVPAVFLPGARSHDDQFERVRSLESRGLAVVIGDSSVEQAATCIADHLFSPDKLRDQQQRIASQQIVPGNEQAARLLLQLASRTGVKKGYLTRMTPFQGPFQGHQVAVYSLECIGKAYADDTGPTAFRVMACVHDALHRHAGAGTLAVPRPLMYDPAARLLLQTRAPGTPYVDLVRSADCDHHLRSAGRALAQLHALKIDLATVGISIVQMPDHIRQLMRPDPEHLATEFPAHRRRITAALHRLRVESASWQRVPTCLIHRDFHLRQLFADQGRVWLVDWDSACGGDPAFDVAYFTSYLRSHLPECRHAATIGTFLDGYFASAASDMLPRLPIYETFNLLRRACRRVRLRDAGWLQEAERMLQAVEE